MYLIGESAVIPGIMRWFAYVECEDVWTMVVDLDQAKKVFFFFFSGSLM